MPDQMFQFPMYMKPQSMPGAAGNPLSGLVDSYRKPMHEALRYRQDTPMEKMGQPAGMGKRTMAAGDQLLYPYKRKAADGTTEYEI